MSHSQTQHSKFLASLLTSSNRSANARSGTLSHHLATQESIFGRGAARLHFAVEIAFPNGIFDSVLSRRSVTDFTVDLR